MLRLAVFLLIGVVARAFTPPLALQHGTSRSCLQATTEDRVEGETVETRELSLADAFEEGVNRAMRADAAVLGQVLDSQCQWDGPMGKFSSRDEAVKELRELGQFFTVPQFTVTNSAQNGKTVEWLASFNWPLPWNPRIILRGSSEVATNNGKITQVKDSWEGSLLGLVLGQALPGFWDIWHQFSVPMAEKYPYRVIGKGSGYEIREYAPRLAIQPTIVDRTNSRAARKAGCLPMNCFTGTIETKGKDPEQYFSTSPLEVMVEPFIEEVQEGEQTVRRRANRITWSVPVPSLLGLDPSKIPSVVREDDKPNEAAGEKIELVYQEKRVIAVTSFNGMVQDREAGDVRKNLVAALEKDKVSIDRTEGGRPKYGYLSYDTRVSLLTCSHISTHYHSTHAIPLPWSREAKPHSLWLAYVNPPICIHMYSSPPPTTNFQLAFPDGL
ncbi:unnamed protein product [Chrysoparadoxa australica]